MYLPSRQEVSACVGGSGAGGLINLDRLANRADSGGNGGERLPRRLFARARSLALFSFARSRRRRFPRRESAQISCRSRCRRSGGCRTRAPLSTHTTTAANVTPTSAASSTRAGRIMQRIMSPAPRQPGGGGHKRGRARRRRRSRRRESGRARTCCGEWPSPRAQSGLPVQGASKSAARLVRACARVPRCATNAECTQEQARNALIASPIWRRRCSRRAARQKRRDIDHRAIPTRRLNLCPQPRKSSKRKRDSG